MKIRHILFILPVVMLLSSCGARYNNPEELAVPIIHAIQNNSESRLCKLLPKDNQVNEVFENNKGAVGYVYYNKYTRSYRTETLKAKIHNCLYIINDISQKNNLDWDKVKMGPVTKKDVTDSASNYTIVTTSLRFPNGDYDLSYHAVNADNRWMLLDDIYFAKTQPQQ